MSRQESRFAKGEFGRFLFGGLTPEVIGAEILEDFYTLEVEDSNRSLLARLPDWTSGQYEQKVNRPSSLTFTYPLTDDAEKVAFFVWPNVIVIRDKTGALVDRLSVAKIDESGDSSDVFAIRVQCQGLMAQLGREMVTSYDVPSAISIQDIIESLFNNEQINTKIRTLSIGRIDASIGNETRQVEVVNKTILQVVNELHRTIGGFMYVDGLGKFYWKRTTPHPAGRPFQEIRWNKNMGMAKRSRDFRTIKTRLVILGQGTDGGDERVTATVNSGNQGTYGIIEDVISNQNIRKNSEASDYGDSLIDRLKVPQETLTFSAIDLSKINTTLDYSHEYFRIGTVVRIVHDTLNLTANRRIVRITRDLASPIHVQIEVSNPSAGADAWGNNPYETQKNLAEMIADIIEKIQLNEVSADDAESEVVKAFVANGWSSDFDINAVKVGDLIGGPTTDADARHTHDLKQTAAQVAAAILANIETIILPKAPVTPAVPGSSGRSSDAEHQHPASADYAKWKPYP